jgi:hypothetical protein
VRQIEPQLPRIEGQEELIRAVRRGFCCHAGQLRREGGRFWLDFCGRHGNVLLIRKKMADNLDATVSI